MKKKLAYMPKMIKIGLFELSFEGIHEAIWNEINYLQIKSNSNMPI